jgi:hypothetical protein
MRILIDECVDPRVAKLFAGHDVKTVHDMGWGRLPDGPLLKLAEGAFDVLITIDRSLEYQQNLRKLSLGVVVVDVPKNQMPYYVAVGRDLLSAVNRLRPGQVIHV